MSNLTTGDVRDILKYFGIRRPIAGPENAGEWLELTSPLGERYSFALYHDDTAESLSEELTEFAKALDADEHAAWWFTHLREAPAPIDERQESLANLLNDANDIKDRLLGAADFVDRCVTQGKVLVMTRRPHAKGVLLDNLVVHFIEDWNFELERTSDGDVRVDRDGLTDSMFVSFNGGTYRISIGEVI